MQTKNIVIRVLITSIVLAATLVVFILLYAWGPVFLLRLTPYEEMQRRTAFPQWINNDEICYVELVLHRDKTVFEQGKFILFIKNPIMDIYIYREKAGHPETKKLIKHIARRHIQPSQSLEGSLDRDIGFRVYDNGKKIFLYYNYYGGIPSDYRYATLDITGGNFKERTPEIIPFDISEDGEKLYGVRYDNFYERHENYILEYSIRDNNVKKLIEITENRFEGSKRGDVKDLKLISKDKLVFAYTGDSSKLDRGNYIYLVNISDSNVELIDKLFLSSSHFNAIAHYYGGEYVIVLPNGFVISKDEKFLIAGNIGIYGKKDDVWVLVKDFYKEYPSVSPTGEKLAYIDVLMNKDAHNWPVYVGRKLAIVSFEDSFKDKGTAKEK